MAGKIILVVTEGVFKGKEFSFEEHDTLLLGRMSDCHIIIPEDTEISRHHFLLEADPPEARVRDLGSLNGTYVNDKKIGSRHINESPEEGAKRQYPEVDLKNGDELRVGKTKIKVVIETKSITIEIIRCSRCGKNVSNEVGSGRSGEYTCEECQKIMRAGEIPKINIHIPKNNKLDENKPELADYEHVKKLAEGGQGIVHLMRHKVTGDLTALKMMIPQKAANEKAQKFFLREVEATQQLVHDNLIELFDFDCQKGIFYFLMEYCDLGNISDLMIKRGGILDISEAKSIFLQAMRGLAFLHSNGFVHRDLKPQNILLKSDGQKTIVKVTDLGLAKNFSNAGLSGFTVTGSYAGTYYFMPREQITNYKYVKPPTDVWSMGATLYYMLSGFVPYDFPIGKDAASIILSTAPVSIQKRNITIPAKLAAVIDKSINVEVQKRFADANEMLEALENAWK